MLTNAAKLQARGMCQLLESHMAWLRVLTAAFSPCVGRPRPRLVPSGLPCSASSQVRERADHEELVLPLKQQQSVC